MGRVAKLLLALWWTVWSCLIVPAHTRGAISVDGRLARTADGGGVSLFFSSLPSCCQPKSEPGEKAPPSSSSSNCAICMIVANTGLTADVPPAVEAPRQCLLVFVSRAPQVRSAAFAPVYLGRAPPA